jgi:tetratricopeptide (TPR) repeat protein
MKMQTDPAYKRSDAPDWTSSLATRVSSRGLLATIAVLGIIALALPAGASPIDDCNQVRNLDRQLRGCTAYIKSGIGTPENTAVAHLNRANVYARRGKLDLALADYAAALRLDPKNPLVPYNRGNAYFDAKQYERAIADFTQAIALDADFALAYYNRGLARERLGDPAAAAGDYKRALTLDPMVELVRQGLERARAQ